MGGSVDRQKDDQLLALLAQGMNQGEAAREMGVSRQRVSQRIKALKARGVQTPTPSKVANPKQPYLKELWESLSCSQSTLGRIMKDLGLTGKGPLTEEQVNQIKEEFTKRFVIPCKRCGQSFRRVTHGMYCRDCRPAVYKDLRKRPRPIGEDNASTVMSPYLVLRDVPPGDEWVTWTRAIALTGQSPMQFEWLVMRGLLAWKSDPTQFHGPSNKQRKLYSAAHCHKIAQIRKEGEGES